MTVDADAADVTLRNVVVGNGDSPPEPCPDCSTEHHVPPSTPVPPNPPLPQTGASASLEGLLLGLLLAAGGLLAVVGGRRRRRD